MVQGWFLNPMLPRQRENNKMTEDGIKRKEGNMFHRRIERREREKEIKMEREMKRESEMEIKMERERQYVSAMKRIEQGE